MSKHQITFIACLVLLIGGIVLDFFDLGIFPKIMVLVGGVFVIIQSILHKREALEKCETLEAENNQYEQEKDKYEEQLKTYKERAERLEQISSISQKQLNEIQLSESLETLTGRFISSVCEDLKASKGAFFLNIENKLDFKSGFAYHKTEEGLSFELGEGLIGQAAQNKKPMLLTDIPKDYVEVQSGLGHANPKNVIIQPILLNNDILGVFEIATFHTLTEDEINLIQLLANNLASKITSFSK